MNFKDEWAVRENGEKFVFTVRMQRELAERGLPVEPAYLKELGIQPRASTPRYEVEESEEIDETEETVAEHKPAQERREPADDFDAPATIQIDPQTGKYIGRMKWYNVKKGYGFIVRGGGEEIFFHKTGMVGDPIELKEGQWILYDVEETHKGPEATDVEPYQGDDTLLS